MQEVLHAYPQIIVDPLDTGVVRVRLSGDAYNRKTLNRVKKTLPKPQVCLLFDLFLFQMHFPIFPLFMKAAHYFCVVTGLYWPQWEGFLPVFRSLFFGVTETKA